MAVEGEIVALDLAASRYLTTNKSGAVLWGILIKGGTKAELIAALMSRFSIDGGHAERDVDTFLATLDQRGLLVRS